MYSARAIAVGFKSPGDRSSNDEEHKKGHHALWPRDDSGHESSQETATKQKLSWLHTLSVSWPCPFTASLLTSIARVGKSVPKVRLADTSPLC
jgi:hypothetical protein